MMKRKFAMLSVILSLPILLAHADPTPSSHLNKSKATLRPVLKPLTLHEKVVLLFDRLAFGPRPGEVEKLERKGWTGIQVWISNQLYPISLSDVAVEKKLSIFAAPTMTALQLQSAFKRPEEVAVSMGIKKEDFQKNDELKKQLREKIGEDFLPEAIDRQMVSQRLIRAVESRRQLQEVLTDFWLNHFNIDISKGEEKWLLPEFERNVIRKNIFGTFGDMLKASAHSPAMLFYLDNQVSQSAVDYSNPGKGPQPRKNGGGLNENYAREILELHSLGVEGGYTQTDVTELARILTGWSIDNVRENPVFKFKDRVHDEGEKVFLGEKFPAGHGSEYGIAEGDRALEMISSSKSTAHFISFKLARYFVADNPPSGLVDRLARNFERTHGDLRSLYRELFSSPEFWSRSAAQSKVKKPTQFVVSSIRALGGELELKTDLPKVLNSMGEEPYRCAPPTGYKDTADYWVNPGAMVSRLGYALKLSSNRLEGVYITLPRIDWVPNDSQSDLKRLVRQVEFKLLHHSMSDASENVVMHEFQDETRTMAEGELRPLSLSKACGLVLGSPEFQRR